MQEQATRAKVEEVSCNGGEPVTVIRFSGDITSTSQATVLGTYQGLGFLQNDHLIIQSPVKKLKEYIPDFKTGSATEVPLNDTLAKKAIAYYQVAS